MATKMKITVISELRMFWKIRLLTSRIVLEKSTVLPPCLINILRRRSASMQ